LKQEELQDKQTNQNTGLEKVQEYTLFRVGKILIYVNADYQKTRMS